MIDILSALLAISVVLFLVGAVCMVYGEHGFVTDDRRGHVVFACGLGLVALGSLLFAKWLSHINRFNVGGMLVGGIFFP